MCCSAKRRIYILMKSSLHPKPTLFHLVYIPNIIFCIWTNFFEKNKKSYRHFRETFLKSPWNILFWRWPFLYCTNNHKIFNGIIYCNIEKYNNCKLTEIEKVSLNSIISRNDTVQNNIMLSVWKYFFIYIQSLSLDLTCRVN